MVPGAVGPDGLEGKTSRIEDHSVRPRTGLAAQGGGRRLVEYDVANHDAIGARSDFADLALGDVIHHLADRALERIAPATGPSGRDCQHIARRTAHHVGVAEILDAVGAGIALEVAGRAGLPALQTPAGKAHTIAVARRDHGVGRETLEGNLRGEPTA